MNINYTPDNTIVENVKIVEHSDDVNYDMYDDILGTEKTNQAYEENGVNIIHIGNIVENTPIKIEYLKKIIDKFENEKCNYISIEYNIDHSEYLFYGVDTQVATENDIENFLEKDKEEKEKKAAFLRKKADEMLKEAEKLCQNMKWIK